MRRLALLMTAAALACGGGDGGPPTDEALTGLDLLSVEPGTVVPGTRIVIEGRSFVEEPWGSSYLQLEGELDGQPVDALLPATFVDYDHLAIDVDGEVLAALGADAGDFEGDATVVVDSGVDGNRYRSEPLTTSLSFRSTLEPVLSSATPPGVTFVNSEVAIAGSGFLLGGNEGQTVAIIEGLFEDDGGDLVEIGPVDVPVQPVDGLDRDTATMVISPEIAGIEAGVFVGEIRLENRHLAGENVAAQEVSDLGFDLVETTVFGVNPGSVSLGQYMVIDGGGFVGDGATTIKLEGSFTPAGSSEAVPLGQLIELVPQYVDGGTLRYVLNEDDLPLDLRRDTGTFQGELIPVVEWGGTVLEGESALFDIEIAPVKQVVYLKFTNNFVEALRDFGLRGVEQRIRDRVAWVVSRDYATVNVEVRLEKPEDFAYYAEVEIGGEDPQGLGLLGYDNTPGKDVGNLRLYDRLGGVNATTQQDGYPGYGGVFVESLFAFSAHPPKGMSKSSTADPLFDDIFDYFRPDRDGRPVRAADLQGIDSFDIDGSDCPAEDRQTRVKCAVFVLGNAIGTTLSHEIGHSLGLANPYGTAFHNPFDEPNRLMDSGGDRPFSERAQLAGDGPGVFCEDEYQYLREILPTSEPADTTSRPGCF